MLSLVPGRESKWTFRVVALVVAFGDAQDLPCWKKKLQIGPVQRICLMEPKRRPSMMMTCYWANELVQLDSFSFRHLAVQNLQALFSKLWAWSITVNTCSKIFQFLVENPTANGFSAPTIFPQAVGVGGSTTATGPLWLGTWATTRGLAEVSNGHGHGESWWITFFEKVVCMILYACIYYNLSISCVYIKFHP